MSLRKRADRGKRRASPPGELASNVGSTRWAPVPVNSPLIDGTLEFWQPKTTRRLSREDAREIVENLTGFFLLLTEWELQDRKRRQAGGTSTFERPGLPD